MSSSRLFGVLAVLVTGIALIASPWAASQPTTLAQAMDLATPSPTPPYQTDPIGIEAPLGRYAEPADPSLELDGVTSAPSMLNGTAPTMGTNFDGIGMEIDDDSYLHSPPDTHAATGTDRIVEITNGHVVIYSKSGTLIAGGDTGGGAVDLDAFCGNEGCYDPKVIYDQASNRFVAVVLEGKTAAASYLHVMVSKTSSPANLTTDWDKFRHSASANISATNGWFDYPGLGVSPDAVVVTGNIFPDGGGLPLGTKIRVFDKTELYDGDATATYQDIDNTLASAGFTIQPAHHLSSPPAGTFYLLARSDPTSLAVWALTGVPASPSLNGGILTTPDQGTCVSTTPQMGTSKEIDTVCPRMMNAVWRDGSLWGTLTGSDATDSRAVVQWFEIETNGYPSGTPSLRQHGAIDGGTGEFTFMPSIAVDANGNAAMTYSQSSSSRYPEMRYTARGAGDSLNSMRNPVVAKTSVSFYDDFTGPPERWGDYSSTVVDPADGSFWICNEYVKMAASGGGNNGRWGTWHANFAFQASNIGWEQVNTDGFGDGANGAIESLEIFNDQLYAGATNYVDGAQIWRTSNGTTWTTASSPGFGSAYTNTNTTVFDMVEFDDQLYAGTGSWSDDGVPGQIWRSPNGTSWTLVEGNGFGNSNNVAIVSLSVLADAICAATLNGTDGLEIWCSSTGDNGDWSSLVTGGNGDADNALISGMIDLDYIYVAVENQTDGAEIWRTSDGSVWTPVATGGFGNMDNTQTGGFSVIDDRLCVGTRNDTTGGQIYCTANGTTWTQEMDNGFGATNNIKIESLMTFGGQLYAVTSNSTTGMEAWRSSDVSTWTQTNADGFGDANNESTLWSNASAEFQGDLYVGTMNFATGGEVWRLDLSWVYLPLVLRDQ